jgi:hypothetical protein
MAMLRKGARGYKVASIEKGAVHLTCQLIAGKLVCKNRPTQVSRLCSRPRREVCRGITDELGEVPGESTRD